MKKKLIYVCALVAIGFASCQENNQPANTTNNADTAVLVDDPSNTLNASPVNDTLVADTVHAGQ